MRKKEEKQMLERDKKRIKHERAIEREKRKKEIKRDRK